MKTKQAQLPEESGRPSEMFPKPPPGYRSATTEEELEIIKRGTAINFAQNTIRRCDAEIRAAKMEMQEANRQLAQSQAVMEEFNRRLGIEGVRGDIETGPDGKMYILVDKAARDAARKSQAPPPNPKEEKE